MKKLLNFVKIYLLPILLIIICSLRIFFYSFPPPKQKNFVTQILITQPIFIEENQIIVKSSNYTIKTHNINFNKNVEPKMGDVIKVTGTRYYSTVYADSIEYVGGSKIKPLFLLKEKFLQSSNQLLVEPYSSLLNGMLLGTDPVILPSFKDQLVKAGVIHIIVVSGFNISILFAFVSKLFVGSSIKVKTLVGSVIVVFYCLVVGLEPPVVRALVMGLLVGYSKAFGYARNTLYILIVTALLLIIVNPLYVTNVSFLLTVTASLGLIILAEPFLKVCEKNKFFNSFPFLLKESIASSFVAQIYVLPIVALFFGRISIVGFIVNPLVVWVVPFVMLIGFVLITLNLIGLGFVASQFVFILYGFLMFFVDIVKSMSNIPFSQIDISINYIGLIISYTLIAIFSYYIIKKYNNLTVKFNE